MSSDLDNMGPVKRCINILDKEDTEEEDNRSDYSEIKSDPEIDENVEINQPATVTYSKTYSDILSINYRSKYFTNSKSMPQCNLIKVSSILKDRKVRVNSKKNKFPIPNYKLTDNRPVISLESAVCKSQRNLIFENGNFKILIVDDMAKHRGILELNLNSIIRAKVEHAKDGIEGYQMYENYAKNGYMYKLIFMDVMMPRMDGYKSSQKIREIEEKFGYEHTLICGMSGDYDSHQKCISAGMDLFGKFYLVTKPPQIEELKMIIERAGFD